MSTDSPRALTPLALSEATVASTASWPRAQTATLQPSAARASAVARPIPLLAPARTALRPLRPRSIACAPCAIRQQKPARLFVIVATIGDDPRASSRMAHGRLKKGSGHGADTETGRRSPPVEDIGDGRYQPAGAGPARARGPGRGRPELAAAQERPDPRHHSRGGYRLPPEAWLRPHHDTVDRRDGRYLAGRHAASLRDQAGPDRLGNRLHRLQAHGAVSRRHPRAQGFGAHRRDGGNRDLLAEHAQSGVRDR